ncbi:Leucyl-tRNA synthetase, mitochondrial [Phlyctochytrium bullatum]|nr:Leucyl-tRNA synthetase, mitochondrial [Phlyctochytrium bullatum]
MGHLRVYTIGDVIARFERMRNTKDCVVLNPMGWDAFGLPAENAAIDRGIDPNIWTKDNIDIMRKQIQSMGTAFDWDRVRRELATCDPDYYKWTQFLFLKLHEAGLIYRKGAVVNWDPVDQTVIANEQVDSQGRAERSGAVVEKKILEQWFARITAFSDELLKDLDSLDWPEKVKTLQANWIGKEEGFEYPATVKNHENLRLLVFSPRKALNMGIIYVSPTHPLLQDIKIIPPTHADAVASYLDAVRLGKIPDYDGTDHVVSIKISPRSPLLSNDGFEYATARFDEAVEEESSAIEVKAKTVSLLRDWLVSRQRYWGTPIPMIHCDKCGVVPVLEKDLPVVLPKDIKCQSTNARRDPDTMDTFLDSSWYWLRYIDPKNASSICKPDAAASCLPVDTYIGGVEHSIMHLLYARFIGKFLSNASFLSESSAFRDSEFRKMNGEPFKSLLVQGMAIIKSSGKTPVVTFEKMSKSKFNGVNPTVA